MPDDIDLTVAPLDEADRTLLADLAGAMAEARPVPPGWVQAGIDSFTWRSIDAELAELAYDSLADAGPLVRGAGTDGRMLVFEAPGLRLEIAVDEGDGRCRLIGQILPAGATAVEIRHADGVTSVPADEHGRFRADGIGRGPLSLRCTIGGSGTSPAAPRFVETSWLVV